jgi:hypothetical protein
MVAKVGYYSAQMKTLKLQTALKLKNRLAGEMSRLQAIVSRENSRRNDNPSKVKTGEVFAELKATRAKLIALKSAIAAANVEIYPKLAEMEEIKSFINFLQDLNTREGKEITHVGLHQEQLVYEWTVFLSQEVVDDMVKVQQDKIAVLQDEVDEFNATKAITVDL